jgi:flagellar FliJ protein
MLADVAALGSHHLATAREAQAVFDAVRARALTLEKLEARHDETARSEDLHGEQILLDEMATTGWHRVRGGDARCP